MVNTLKYITAITELLAKNKDKLNELDQAIGDGDHGTNIVRGFEACLKNKDKFTEQSTYDADLMLCSQSLMSQVGGSSGPLLGVSFMKLSAAFKGQAKITNQIFAKGLENACAGISMFGGQSKVGDKTMLDALIPAANALKNSQSETLDFAAASAAATKGANSTIDLIAKKGRASYLGERSVGHMDPGACSVSLIFQALAEVK